MKDRLRPLALILALLPVAGSAVDFGVDAPDSHDLSDPALDAALAIPEVTAIEAGDCADPGSVVRVAGRDLAPPDNRAVVLGGHGLHRPLEVLEWRDARIEARLPASGAIAPGKRYYIGIHDEANDRWLSNIDVSVLICADAADSAGISGAPTADTEATLAESPAGEDAADDVKQNPFGSSGGRVTQYEPPDLVQAEENVGDGQPDDRIEPREVLLWHANLDRAAAFARRIREAGYRPVRRKALRGLRVVQTTLRIPEGTSPRGALKQLREAFPELVADLNHRYRTLDDAGALELVEWTPAAAACERAPVIGVIDTGIDASVLGASTGDIAIERVPPAGTRLAPTDHGTAVAARLVQLVPGARLRAAAVFRRRGDEMDTTAEWLVTGLDWLARQQAEAINLSLGGPHNGLLARAVVRLRRLGIKLAAAVGDDDGRPSYPASDPNVVGVIAVDRDLRPAADAYSGDAVVLAAPGIDVRVPGIDRYLSGASHAAPFVTAALALAPNPGTVLREARDLGEPGRDPVYGYGLVRFADSCSR